MAETPDKMNKQWLLASRPTGRAKESDFSWRESPVPTLANGQVLVRSIYLSLDPSNRSWLNPTATYLPPVEIGDVMRGVALGVVIASKTERFSEGDLVQGSLGWQRYYAGSGRGLTRLETLPGVPLDAYLGLFGIIGLTAYVGLLDFGEPKAGETLVVSGAAGAVGSLAAQIGKILGLRVIGTAGTDEKCRYLTEELGLDGAINYRTSNLRRALREHCPDGIDVFFDNVGGEILETVLAQINLYARIVLCGMISQYNAPRPEPGPSTLINLIPRRGKMQGFIVLDHFDRAGEAYAALGRWYAEGKLSYRTHIIKGLENAPAALDRLFTGEKQGKLIVQVSELPDI